MKAFIKYILFCLPAILWITNVHAQNIKPPVLRVSITGKITNAKTGEPLAGASISFPDLRKGTVSDTMGMYRIQNVSAGRYLIVVSFLGFSSAVENIDIMQNAEKNFSLKPSFVETREVTITGVSSATSVKRTPIAVSIIKKDDLFRNSSTNLMDALSKTPGVNQVATGPAISKPVIRGLGYNRVVIVNDGIRQEGQQWGDEHGIEIDELNVSRVEVLKGPASLMYGSDALAGVINVVSIVPAPNETIKGNVLSSYQGNNRQRALHSDIGGNHNGFIWGAYGSYKAAADYKNKYDDHVFNSRFNEENYGGYIGVNKSWGFSHLYFSRFNQHVGLVEGDRDSATGKFLQMINNAGNEVEVLAGDDPKSTDPSIPRQRVQHFKVAIDNSFKLNNGRLTLTVGYQRNQRQEFGNVIDPNEKELFFDLKTVNYNTQYHLKEINNWKTTIGINGMSQTNTNKGIEVLIPEYSLFDIGGFIYSQKQYDRLTLSGGLRFDNRHINSKSFTEAGDLKFQEFIKNFSNVSGSVGLSYQASDAVTLKLNIARGFRAPGIPELASNGAHEGTNRYEYGSQNLKSERSIQLDGGIEINSEHVSLSANLFVNPVKNFIYYSKLSAATGGDSIISEGSDDFFAFSFNQTNATLYGGEANFDIHPHPLDWLHIESTFSYVRGTLNDARDGSNNLPFIPAPRLINQVKAELFKNGKTLKNFYLKAELDNSFVQNHPFTGFNTETHTSGYSLLNTGIGGNIAHNGKTLFSLYFSANNLTDVAYQSHLSRLKYADVNNVTGRQGVYNMGRNFSVKLNVPFTFAIK